MLNIKIFKSTFIHIQSTLVYIGSIVLAMLMGVVMLENYKYDKSNKYNISNISNISNI